MSHDHSNCRSNNSNSVRAITIVIFVEFHASIWSGKGNGNGRVEEFAYDLIASTSIGSEHAHGEHKACMFTYWFLVGKLECNPFITSIKYSPIPC